MKNLSTKTKSSNSKTKKTHLKKTKQIQPDTVGNGDIPYKEVTKIPKSVYIPTYVKLDKSSIPGAGLGIFANKFLLDLSIDSRALVDVSAFSENCFNVGRRLVCPRMP